jgi:hypothetical protein
VSRSPSPDEAQRLVEQAKAETSANGHGSAQANQSRRLVLTPASKITPRPVRWGWADRLPAGHVSLIAGREGIGKSLLLIA